jgi:probable F420-dependent oxidoreductase
MKIGVTLPPVDGASQEALDAAVRFAIQADGESCIESVWVVEHLLWPIASGSSRSPPAGSKMPREFQPALDPVELLAFIAARTKRVMLGTSVIDILFHSPIILARRLATLDILSNGRLVCGLGLGWSNHEYQHSATPARDRGKKADEFVQALRHVWDSDGVQFDGDHYHIPPLHMALRPVQRPRLALHLGGFSPAAFARVARYCDGWIGVAGAPLEYVERSVQAIRDSTTKLGRDPGALEFSILASPDLFDVPLPEDRRLPFAGTMEQIGADIARMERMGATRAILNFSYASRSVDPARALAVAKELANMAAKTAATATEAVQV